MSLHTLANEARQKKLRSSELIDDNDIPKDYHASGETESVLRQIALLHHSVDGTLNTSAEYPHRLIQRSRLGRRAYRCGLRKGTLRCISSPSGSRPCGCGRKEAKARCCHYAPHTDSKLWPVHVERLLSEQLYSKLGPKGPRPKITLLQSLTTHPLYKWRRNLPLTNFDDLKSLLGSTPLKPEVVH